MPGDRGRRGGGPLSPFSPGAYTRRGSALVISAEKFGKRVYEMRKGYIFIASTTLLFSSMEVALKSMAGRFDPIQLTLLRFAVGGLFLLPFALRGMRSREVRVTARDLGFFAIMGFVCVVVSMTLYQMAIGLVEASIVAILFSCNPVFVIPLAALVLKEKVRGLTILSLVLSVAGMLAIANPFHIGGGAAGAALTILSAAVFALYTVLGKTRSRIGGLATTSLSFILGSLELLALVLVSRIPAVAAWLGRAGFAAFAFVPLLKGLDLSTLPVFLYVGFGVTGLGYAFYFLAIEETSAATAAVVFYIKPALAPVLALLFLGESITPNTLLGMALVVAGSAFAFAGNRRRGPG
jgi:drug/metabolite transporter (DMT)-like permease